MQNGPPYEEHCEVAGSLTSAVPPKSLTTAHCLARAPPAKVTDLIRSGVKPRRCRAAAFSSSTPAPLCADPRCSISRDPRWEEYTICTAVAPEDVFTVRTYGTRQLYGHPASAHFQSPQPTKPQVSNPQDHSG